MLTIGSAFSGIGALELGLVSAGFGPVVWQIEINARLRHHLQERFPHAIQYADIRNIRGADIERVSLICGGFPCHDLSSANIGGAGLAGPRSSLAFELLRLIGESCPRWVVVENVASGANEWVDVVSGELEKLGYASLPIPIAAADVGAPHERPRVFVIACNPNGFDEPVVSKHAQVARLPRASRRLPDWSERPRAALDDGASAWMGEAIGNAVVPQCAEVIGHAILQLCALELVNEGGM